MFKLRIALMVALIMALLLPLSVQAAGVFYCSTLRASGGTGTWADPWACTSTEQLNHVIYEVICPQGGGWLYQSFASEYIYYRIDWVNNQCSYTYWRYPGTPPRTGVNLPMPLMVGSLAVVGVAMVAGGLVLRRKTHR